MRKPSNVSSTNAEESEMAETTTLQMKTKHIQFSLQEPITFEMRLAVLHAHLALIWYLTLVAKKINQICSGLVKRQLYFAIGCDCC